MAGAVVAVAAQPAVGGTRVAATWRVVLHTYAVVGVVALAVLGLGLLAAAVWRPDVRRIEAPPSWKQHRFGFAVYALIFLAFDMEMIFMYPWGVVFAEIGVMAFLDMLVFVGLLGAGIAYAWGMGGLEWE